MWVVVLPNCQDFKDESIYIHVYVVGDHKTAGTVAY
jgi:hypothetical protein